MSKLIEVEKRFRVIIKDQTWSSKDNKYTTTTLFDSYLTELEIKELRRKINYQINKKLKE